MANKDELWFVYTKGFSSGRSGPFTYDQLAEQYARGEIDGRMTCEKSSLWWAFLAIRLTLVDCFPEFVTRRENPKPSQLQASDTVNIGAISNLQSQTNAGSDWASFLRFIGIVSGIAGFIGLMIGFGAGNSDVRLSGWYLLVVGVGHAIYSFFLAFLVDVFLDIRLSLRKLVDKKEKE